MTGAAYTASALFGSDGEARAASAPNPGDVAILRLLAAAELIEADLWTQYAELGGVSAANAYQAAFLNLDGDGNQYITSNTLDEVSHAQFLNAYLSSIGAKQVDFDPFRILKGSKAAGSSGAGRLTNLMQLKVDTSWFTRYRSASSPDFGATFAQALPALAAQALPAIPRTNADLTNPAHVQAIANTAAFHFGAIEQAGSSLYAAMAQKVSSGEVLEIVLGIGGDEICHFLEWVDFAGNSVQGPVAPLTDPTNGLTFPDFNATGNPLLQTNLIFPVPCEFIRPNLPKCSVIRPIGIKNFTAVDAVTGLFDSGLFIGQSDEFLATLLILAVEADLASRV